MRSGILTLSSLAALAFSAGPARADLLGDSISTSYFTGGYSTPPNLNNPIFTLQPVTVPSTQTLPNGLGFRWTFTANQISFNTGNLTGFASYGNPYFNGLVFTDITKNAGISAVALDSASPNPGAIVTFDSDHFIINFVGATLTTNETFTYDLSFPSATAATPEPASLILLATGLFFTTLTLGRRGQPLSSVPLA